MRSVLPHLRRVIVLFRRVIVLFRRVIVLLVRRRARRPSLKYPLAPRQNATRGEGWWAVTDSNRRHSACKADALPTELTALTQDLSLCDLTAQGHAVDAQLPHRA